MKKLLILMLVLGITSAVQATTLNLTLGSADTYTDVLPGTVITVTLTVDNNVRNFKEGIDFTASGTNALAIGAGGWQVGNSSVSPDGTETGGDIVDAYMLATTGEQYAAGTVLYQFSATINEDGHIGMANVSCIDPAFLMPPTYYTIGALNGLDVTIPEPMTILLLGLGGLFLRRRR